MLQTVAGTEVWGSSERDGGRAHIPVRLSARQAQVLELLSEGLPNKLIARRLQISLNTTKTHIQSILEAFEASNRLQAVVRAYRAGVLRVVPPDSVGGSGA